MKVFKRVPVEELYLKKPTNKSNGIWWDGHLLHQGGYQEIENMWDDLHDSVAMTVAISYEE